VLREQRDNPMMRMHLGGSLESIRRWMDKKPLAVSEMQGEEIVGVDRNRIKGRIWG